jgi:hypothetical protein
MKAEADPNGLHPNVPGAKLDAGKKRPSLLLRDFNRALQAVLDVAEHGATKYTVGGWLSVPDGPARYTDALLRHLLADLGGELRDRDSELTHAAHAAWNALARLELLLRDPAATAHAELQDLLRQRYEQLGPASVYGISDGTRATQRPCRGCDGTGNCAIDPAHDIRCPACHGEGVRYWIDCPDCARTGFTPGSGGDSATFCPKCRGKGELPVTGDSRRVG